MYNFIIELYNFLDWRLYTHTLTWTLYTTYPDKLSGQFDLSRHPAPLVLGVSGYVSCGPLDIQITVAWLKGQGNHSLIMVVYRSSMMSTKWAKVGLSPMRRNVASRASQLQRKVSRWMYNFQEAHSSYQWLLFLFKCCDSKFIIIVHHFRMNLWIK